MQTRFPTREEIAGLREKGIVPVSAFASRIAATTFFVAFLWKSNWSSRFVELWRGSGEPDNIEQLLPWTISVVTPVAFAILFSMVVFVAASLLQTRFFFRPSHLVRPTQAIFDLRRVSSGIFHSLFLLLIVLLLGAVTAVTLDPSRLIAFFLAVPSSLLEFKPEEIGAEVSNSFRKWSQVGLGLLFVVFAFAVAFAKIRFNVKHRIETGPGAT